MGVERYKEDCTELLVYLVESPEHGPGYRFFDDADIFVAGGVLAIESEMEKQSDRFVRLGVIEAKKDGNRIRFTDEDLAALPVPGEEQWRIGRLSPAYGRSELDETISRIKKLHCCTSDPKDWIENMSLCVESGHDFTLSEVEDFCS